MTIGRSRKAPGARLRTCRAFVRLVMCSTLACTLAACGQDFAPGPAPNESNARLEITNDEGELEARIDYFDDEVPVDSEEALGVVALQESFSGPMAAYVERAASRIRLRLYAEVLPPTVAGEVVQATSVALEGGDKAMVSYNMRGAPRLGAIDWITKLTSRRPRISSEVAFKDSDISAVATDGAYVYAAAASNAPGLPFPAVLERIRLLGNKLRLRNNKRVALVSFAATSVMRTSDEIYVTSGDTGEVVALDKQSLDVLGEYSLDDARWSVWDKDGGTILVVQGTPGRISMFAEGEFPGGSMDLLNTYPFPGANVPQSKSTADVAGDKAYIAAGPDGVQIMCLEDGRVLGSVPRPDPARLGLDPAVVVTNAVAVDKDLMFISNGEAGVYVAMGTRDFKDSECDDPEITVVGRLRFNDLQSVNHVAFENDYLFVAAGLGGVKVVRVFR